MEDKRGLRRQLPLLSEKEIEQQNSWLKTNEAKEFFNNNDEWKVCEYNIEKDPSAYWVNIVHEEEIIAYKTYIVKTSYGIITLNELAFEALFDKIGANQ